MRHTKSSKRGECHFIEGDGCQYCVEHKIMRMDLPVIYKAIVERKPEIDDKPWYEAKSIAVGVCLAGFHQQYPYLDVNIIDLTPWE